VAEIMAIIKDASQDINPEIINFQFTIFNQLSNFQFSIKALSH